MKRPPLTTEEAEARRRYFQQGVDEFRRLLEREYQRTHPSGYLNSVPHPSGHDFRVGSTERKVSLDVTLSPIKFQTYSKDGPIPREVQQVRARR